MVRTFAIQIYCKPYIQQYMVQLYGWPCNISKDKKMTSVIKRMLERPSRHRGMPEVSSYKHYVEIMIPSDMFYRYGCMISLEDQRTFNKMMEEKLKNIMRAYILTQASFGIALNDAILNFQHEFDFPEDIWTHESIRKDIQRNGIPDLKNNIRNGILQNINNMYLDNLSQKRTLCAINK